ncbi:hypothetical protein LLH00_15380, partial [bacterium]|nr:hypothetical protein [bacterium]
FGLGMAVVQRIVESLGGAIRVEDCPGGASFLIGLPAASDGPVPSRVNGLKTRGANQENA